MNLVERTGSLVALQAKFEGVANGEGHCIFVSGEAGIGKTSLVKAFCGQVQNSCKIYYGTCDALFTPRPLAPVYDIILQIKKEIWENSVSITDRAALFSNLFHELSNRENTTLIVIEDIHWADEATLDFVKFIGRRITRLPCLFVLTYRDDEIHSHHPLKTVLGQLPPDAFSRLPLAPLSRQAVEKMSAEKGYRGEDVYTISGGNPFYVNEILASYSVGIPENIKDSILSVFNHLEEKVKQVWRILSVLPTGFELKYLETIEPTYAAAIDKHLNLKILILKDGVIFFKHELYRRTIEASLSPYLRIALNKRILDLFKKSFEEKGETERIIHHAKNANEHELVVKYAPLAARQAASVGAHIEARKLYLSAIEYYDGNDEEVLVQLYECYGYECFLTGQIYEAIIYLQKAVDRLEKTTVEKISKNMQLLSWLWWFDCNRKMAETYATRAIEVLAGQPPSRIKAMAFGHLARLKMLSDEKDECLFWGEKATTMADELEDEEITCHTLNSIGTMLAKDQSLRQSGLQLLKQSMDIALKNNYEEYLGHGYTNLAGNAVVMKDYSFAREILEEGIQFCTDREIELGTNYLLAYKSRLLLETGHWNEAYNIASNLLENESQPRVAKIGSFVVLATIKMRMGDGDVLPLLVEAKNSALKTMEPQRIMPVMSALLEYEWITGTHFIEKEIIEGTIELTGTRWNIYGNSEFVFWLQKARGRTLPLKEIYEGYDVGDFVKAKKAAMLWEKIGCPYNEALALFESSEDDKRKAINIIQKLGGNAVYQKMKLVMRSSGIKKIPRGVIESTRTNPAQLTNRELDVLRLLQKGIQNKEIAGTLFISPRTADHHISNILFKLDVNSRTKAVNEAVRLGILI